MISRNRPCSSQNQQHFNEQCLKVIRRHSPLSCHKGLHGIFAVAQVRQAILVKVLPLRIRVLILQRPDCTQSDLEETMPKLKRDTLASRIKQGCSQRSACKVRAIRRLHWSFTLIACSCACIWPKRSHALAVSSYKGSVRSAESICQTLCSGKANKKKFTSTALL